MAKKEATAEEEVDTTSETTEEATAEVSDSDADQEASDRAAEIAAAVPNDDQTELEAKKQLEHDTEVSPVRRDANGALIIN